MWNNYKLDKPKKNGEYICIMRGRYIKILGWANNLYFVDDWSFEKCKNKPGWYDYDSEVGYFEIKDVVAWMPVPIIPEEYR